MSKFNIPTAPVTGVFDLRKALEPFRGRTLTWDDFNDLMLAIRVAEIGNWPPEFSLDDMIDKCLRDKLVADYDGNIVIRPEVPRAEGANPKITCGHSYLEEEEVHPFVGLEKV